MCEVLRRVGSSFSRSGVCNTLAWITLAAAKHVADEAGRYSGAATDARHASFSFFPFGGESAGALWITCATGTFAATTHAGPSRYRRRSATPTTGGLSRCRPRPCPCPRPLRCELGGVHNCPKNGLPGGWGLSTSHCQSLWAKRKRTRLNMSSQRPADAKGPGATPRLVSQTTLPHETTRCLACGLGITLSNFLGAATSTSRGPTADASPAAAPPPAKACTRSCRVSPCACPSSSMKSRSRG